LLLLRGHFPPPFLQALPLVQKTPKKSPNTNAKKTE
jgi:hypothetical protein